MSNPSATEDPDAEPAVRVLIVDDEAIVAYDHEDLVQSLRMRPIGPALTVEEGEALALQEKPHVAILDIDVRGKLIWPLASRLAQDKCFIIFVSANVNHPERTGDFGEHVFLEKPVQLSVLSEVLNERRKHIVRDE